MRRFVATQGELARELGLSPGRVSQLKAREWWPKRTPGGWDVEATRAAYSANIDRSMAPQSGPGAPSTPAAPPSPPAPPRWLRPSTTQEELPPSYERDRELHERLLTETDPLEIARAAAQLAARKVADVAAGNAVATVKDWDHLKKALEELRQQESDHLKLARERGKLIERVDAQATAGQIAQRLVEILSNLEALLATQVEVWLADQAWRSAPTEQRGRVVRTWIQGHARTLRELGADEIDRMLEEAAS